MKAAPLILATSLLCNAALLGFALFRQPPPPAKKTIPAPSPAPPVDIKALAQLFAGDDNHALIQQLLKEGFPTDVIRSIAQARLDKEFAARRAALADPPPDYWRRYSFSRFNPKPDPARRAEKRALDEEYDAALKKLTNDLPPERTGFDQRTYGDLPDAKIAQIKAINEDYNETNRKLRAEKKGATSPSDKAQLDLLIEQEKHAELAKILTPGELRDYDLRSSPLARDIQQQITYLNATEDEYIALYDAQTIINEQTAGQKLSPAELKQLRDDAAQSVLSPERFEEYKLVTNKSYEDVRDLVTWHNLPMTTIAQVITIENETTAQADRIRADTALAPAERDTQLAALAQAAEQQLKTAFGEKAFARYYREDEWLSQSPGKWLRQLTLKPPAQSPQPK